VPEWKQLRDQKTALAAEKTEIEKKVPTTMVMQRAEKPRKTFVLTRGVYNQPAEEVQPGVPASLPPLPPGAPNDRLGLARWLTSPSHPLTSRVMVNRLWQMVFGEGIVRTSEDFGTQGEWPSHPELLDWLAVEFEESGWDVKHTLRLMVESSTYRQTSQADPDLVALDPANRLLARGPRQRLPAEAIRDNALYIAGLLVEKVGGPSVKPYQPPGLWEDVSYDPDESEFTAQMYRQDKGEGLYRRTMYTFWKRSSPPPRLTTFDAPIREVCVVRRERTNTPLQALILMNDPTFVEAARFVAQRVLKEVDGDTDARLSFAFELATSRLPTDAEMDVLRDVLQKRKAAYESDPDKAAELLKVGDSPRDESIDAVEHAAWTNVVSVILNLDETISKS
jgi:hypothetical protein